MINKTNTERMRQLISMIISIDDDDYWNLFASNICMKIKDKEEKLDELIFTSMK